MSLWEPKMLFLMITQSRQSKNWFRAGRHTVARMLERDDFSTRYKNKKPLSILEFLYPLLQGWDSVALKADIELGGTDQKFNLLVGRQFQKEEKISQQVVITLPLLVGTDGVQKMSKSSGNYIGIQEPPKEIFGKLMSISDELMWSYYDLLSQKSISEIKQLKREVTQGSFHPKKAKEALASEMVSRFYSTKEAAQAQKEFEIIFKEKNLPANLNEVSVKLNGGKKGILALMTEIGLTKSNGEARRLIAQGGVKLNKEKVTDPHYQIVKKGEYILQVGKRRFVKILFT